MIRRCGTKPLDLQTQREHEKLFSQWLASPRIQSGHDNITFNIPVVVHVVGNQAFLDSITDARIEDNIRQTNLDFNRRNNNFTNVPSFFQNVAIRQDRFNIWVNDIRRYTANIGNPKNSSVEDDMKLNIAPGVDPARNCNIWLVGDQFDSL